MNLKELAKARGTNIKRIAEEIGVPASTLYAISQGDTEFYNVGVSTFMKIADALGVEVERLYELPSVPPDGTSSYIASLGIKDDDELSAEIDELAWIYRMLDSRGRHMLLSAARGLADSGEVE